MYVAIVAGINGDRHAGVRNTLEGFELGEAESRKSFITGTQVIWLTRKIRQLNKVNREVALIPYLAQTRDQGVHLVRVDAAFRTIALALIPDHPFDGEGNERKGVRREKSAF